jgi:hypothetical protein
VAHQPASRKGLSCVCLHRFLVVRRGWPGRLP